MIPTLVLVWLLTVACLPLDPLGRAQLGAQPDQPGAAIETAYADVLPSIRDSVMATTNARMHRYRMTVRLDPENRTLTGTMSVDFVNLTGDTLSEVYFRLYPNADHYGEGSLDVTNVRVAGHPTDTETSIQDTVLRVPLALALPNGLPPEQRVAIEMDVAVTVPTDSSGSYGIFSYASATRTWVLADWHPVVAAYEADEGWQLDPPLGTIDPTFADSALYDVTLTYPSGWVVATSGVALSDESPATETDEASRTTRYIAGPIREFALAIDDDYETREVTVGETVVRLLSNPNRVEPLTDALAVAEAALARYNERFGPYPFTELDLVDTPLTPGTPGVSWGGIVFLDSASIAAQQGNPAYYDFLVAHEIAHQWIGSVIGINSNDHTFIAEGLTNYIMTMFVEWERGPDAAVSMLESSVAARYLSHLRTSGDQVADVPWIEGGPSFADIVYGKAALGFLAIRLEIGEDAFIEAIRRLASTDDGFAFAIADPEDFLTAFESAGGTDLSALWETWFLSAETTVADVEAVLGAYSEAVREPVAA